MLKSSKKGNNGQVIEFTPLNVMAYAIRTCWQSFGKSDNGGIKDMELIRRVAYKFKHGSTAEHTYISIDVQDNKSLESFLIASPFAKKVSVTGIFITNLRLLMEHSEFFLQEMPELRDMPFGFLLSDDVEVKSFSESNECNIFKTDALVTKLYESSEFNGIKVYTFFINGVSRALLQELARHRLAALSVKSSRYTLNELKRIAVIISSMTIAINKLRKLMGLEIVISDEVRMIASKFIKLTGDDRVDYQSIVALQNLQTLIKNGVGNDYAKYAMPESYLTQLTWTIDSEALDNFLKLRKSSAALWEIREFSEELELVMNA